MTPQSGTVAVAGSTGTVLLSTVTPPRPFTVPARAAGAPQRPECGRRLPLGGSPAGAQRRRDVPLMIRDRALTADPERLERARYRLALNSPPPDTRPEGTQHE